MKKILTLILALALSLTLAVPALAADRYEAEDAAWELYDLGLFRGTGSDEEGFPVFALDRAPTRAEGVTMLVRLIGRDAEALAGTWEIPFRDVPNWAVPYVGYAYANGLTQGRSQTVFDPETPISATEYLTFVLRALGYSSETDFRWDAAWLLSDRLGLTRGEYRPDTNGSFTRGDVTVVSRKALEVPLKGTEKTLRASLEEQDALNGEHLRCLWTEENVTCRPDRLYLAFSALEETPEKYIRFEVEQAVVNGQPCRVTQYADRSEIQGFNRGQPALHRLGEEVLCLCILDYDEQAAKAAAVDAVTLDGMAYPVLDFRIRAVGTLPDGTRVEEMFTLHYFIDGYGGPYA